MKHQEIIDTLHKGNFYTECPCCSEEIALKQTGLFDNDNFSEGALEIYKQQLQLVQDEKARLKKLQQQGTIKSEIAAKSSNIGSILERLAPTLKHFRFNHNDCRSLFDPIDYIIFEGLSLKGKVDKIFFIDIKTGAARLSKKQKEIKAVVQNKKIDFKTY